VTAKAPKTKAEPRERPAEPKFQLRFVDVREVRYLRLEDVAAFIGELGGGEETDVRWRLEEAARNLLAKMRAP
jgi:hypothetical protein